MTCALKTEISDIISLWLEPVHNRFPSLGSIWLIGSRANNMARPDSDWDFVAFGSELLLNRISASKDLHRSDVDFLVVFNGNDFRAAWGETSKQGALSEWQWKELGENRAEYLEAKWSEENKRVLHCKKNAIRVA